MLNVVCVKSPPAYEYHYVNRLHRAVEANLTVPHTFTAVVDRALGIRCRTKQLPRELRGWWAKLYLHKLGVTSGRTLYLDLDTLITGSLDFLADYRGDFAILRDFYRPDGMGSGVMMWNNPHPEIWDRWVAMGMPDHPLGDQGWMEQMVPGADRLQDVFPGKFVSYKVHCQEALPEDAAVLCFHGDPKPADFPADHLISQIWRGEAHVGA